ncbi:ZIP family metal transporter [Polycladomyces subterraneus]|uniref:ZIP family metal transporter n=1 Tax=Polycladomyces subterraneus TaxID=1016997 RepID=A0ABT8IMS5_9BACL|nr:ZIP family metal transporter [Polycladomyces subterraneus]MDN4594064.1 ZIP family metal transporter [Polycladomyces subterraneus]
MAGALGWTVLAALGYVVGGSIVWFKKNWSSQALTMLVALSTGLLLAVSIGGMLPHGLSETPSQAPWLLVGMFAFQKWHMKHRLSSETEIDRRQGAVWSVLSGMGIHAYFEGFAIGAGFHVDPQFGTVVLLALVFHKIPEGVAISTLTRRDPRNVKKRLEQPAFWNLYGVRYRNRFMDSGSSLDARSIVWNCALVLCWDPALCSGNRIMAGHQSGGKFPNCLVVLIRYLTLLFTWVGKYADCSIHHHDVEASANPDHFHDSSHHHMQPVEIPKGTPIPTVHLQVYKDSESGWNLHVQTAHFRFAPEFVNGPNRIGEGHAHLFVDDKKVARLYGPWYHMDSLGPGKHEIRVELFTNQHAPYVHNGTKIEDTAVVIEK